MRKLRVSHKSRDCIPYRKMPNPPCKLSGEMEQVLKAVSGMDGFTFQPTAGAQGEFVGISLIAAYHRAQGNAKKVVLIPDSAHGTNPATAAICGYAVQAIKSTERGTVDVEDLKTHLTEGRSRFDVDQSQHIWRI